MMVMIKDRNGFSTLEILVIIVLVSVALVGGLAIVSVTTKKANVEEFKDEATPIVNAAKNAYLSFVIEKKDQYIATSNDGTTKAMCITINGLRENGFYSQDNDYDGYVVVEQIDSKNFKFSLWFTDKKFVIDGYESTKIKDLSNKDGITEYKDEKFVDKVKNSFKGTTEEKGGTGNKIYEKACVNEKIE